MNNLDIAVMLHVHHLSAQDPLLRTVIMLTHLMFSLLTHLCFCAHKVHQTLCGTGVVQTVFCVSVWPQQHKKLNVKSVGNKEYSTFGLSTKSMVHLFIPQVFYVSMCVCVRQCAYNSYCTPDLSM